MTYGIKFYGANNQLIFDSDFNSGAAVTLNPYSFDAQNNLQPGTSTTSSAITVNNDDLLFLKVNSAGDLFGNMSYPTNTTKTFTPSQSVGYFIARKTSSVGNIVSGNYGLEIYDSSQNVTFSTRRADSSVNIHYIYDDKELVHQDTVYTAGAGESINDFYVSIGHMFRSVGTGTWGCFVYGSSTITFSSNLNLGIFGNASIPNMGSVLVASVRG
jgi:hypothetical protein